RTKRRKRRGWAIRRTGLRVRAGVLRARGHEEAGLRRGVHRGLRQYVRCGRDLHILLWRPRGEPTVSTVRDLLAGGEDRLCGYTAGRGGERRPKAVMRYGERRCLGPATGGHFAPDTGSHSVPRQAVTWSRRAWLHRSLWPRSSRAGRLLSARRRSSPS